MLDSLSASDELNSRGLEGGNGIRRGPVFLDKENSGATHKPSISSRLDLRLMAVSGIDDANRIRVARLRFCLPPAAKTPSMPG